MRSAVEEISGTGVNLVSITCDSLKAQMSMMKNLGANLSPDKLDPQIFKDKQSPIYFIHDISHAIKLVRNAWHHVRQLKNSRGEIIDWGYIERLYEIQNSEHVKCGNRLTVSHLNFQNVRMKVKFAVQVLSRRVSKSSFVVST